MKHLFFKYHKPVGVLSTTLPTKDGRNILQSLSSAQALWLRETCGGRFVVPVGRLDKDSSGLLLLTTHESVTGALLRPGTEGSPFSKVYMVETRKRVQTSFVEAMAKGGIELSIRDWGNKDEKVLTRPCKVERISERVLRMELREGKNRQIRKMLGSKGHAVKSLCRISFGPIHLDDLEPNQLELLTDEQVAELLKPIEGKL